MRLFRKHNKPKQSNIFPEFSDWDQLQSYTKDSNFSNLQPSYDTQYGHWGYPSYEKTNYNSLESLLNNSVIDGDPFTFQGENYISKMPIIQRYLYETGK